jgi:four helix bundle protein
MEDLRERTKRHALRIIRLYQALPQGNGAAGVIGRQLLRSGTSVGAHYREAGRGRSDAEFLSKMKVGLQELDESAYWIELLIEAKIVPAGRLTPLLQETDELIAIFVTIAKKVEEKRKK